LNDFEGLRSVADMRLANEQIERRADIHAALSDPGRLAIVDDLVATDRTPGELARRVGVSPSLLTFHLDALERAGLVRRVRSTADRRRRYIQLIPESVAAITFRQPSVERPVVFVCTHNAARSQIAAAIWRSVFGPATSAGTDPAESIHRGALAAAARAGVVLPPLSPRLLEPADLTQQVITVCDRAHEQLADIADQWHWSIPDPVATGTDADFDDALALIRSRIDHLIPREAT
jgi:protein-tyrosine-phosphatase/DNA-binding HxlR family transcriptional regulator